MTPKTVVAAFVMLINRGSVDAMARRWPKTTTMTDPNYQTYTGADFTINKRYSDKWQLNLAVTVQKRNDYTPEGGYTDPRNIEYAQGLNTQARYIFKLNGSYDLPWGVTASMNPNLLDLSLQKTFSFRGGQNRVKFMLDGFNILNSAVVQGYSSNNVSLTTSTRVSSIVPPRVFRVGAQINF